VRSCDGHARVSERDNESAISIPVFRSARPFQGRNHWEMRDFSRPRGLGKKNALMAGQAIDQRAQKGQQDGRKARKEFDTERQKPQAQEPELGEGETGQGRPLPGHEHKLASLQLSGLANEEKRAPPRGCHPVERPGTAPGDQGGSRQACLRCGFGRERRAAAGGTGQE